MNPLAGKSPTERNKIIAAAVLGLMSLLALYFAFGRSMFAGSTKVTVTASPTPRTQEASPGSRSAAAGDLRMPSRQEQDFYNMTTPVVYSPSGFGAPDAGRNIFAFYEPPPPCPTCTPLPTPIPTPPTPTPTPTPPMRVYNVSPQSVFAGSGAFRLEVVGEKFDPSARIYFNQSELPTQFVNEQRLVTTVPASMIAGAGSARILVQTPDGKLYSDQVMISIQPPPTPQFQYVGMIARAKHNNDTAVFRESNRPEFAARLNDVVGGRFRVISISSAEAVLEDVNLGFRHRLPLYRPEPGSTSGPGQPPGRPPQGEFPAGIYQPYNPNMQNPNVQQQDIPGIPNNIPRYVPPQPGQPPTPQPQKKDDDDDDGDGFRR